MACRTDTRSRGLGRLESHSVAFGVDTVDTEIDHVLGGEARFHELVVVPARSVGDGIAPHATLQLKPDDEQPTFAQSHAICCVRNKLAMHTILLSKELWHTTSVPHKNQFSRTTKMVLGDKLALFRRCARCGRNVVTHKSVKSGHDKRGQWKTDVRITSNNSWKPETNS